MTKREILTHVGRVSCTPNVRKAKWHMMRERALSLWGRVYNNQKYTNHDFYIRHILEYAMICNEQGKCIVRPHHLKWRGDIDLDELYEQYLDEGLCFAEEDRHEEALIQFNLAAGIRPVTCYALHVNRGNVYAGSERYTEALKDFALAQRINANREEVYINRSNVHMILNDHQAALNDLTRSIELLPKNPASYNNRGLVYRKMGRYKEAKKDIMRSLRYDSKQEGTYLNLGLIYEDLDEPMKALDVYDQLLAFSPFDQDALLYKGIIQFELLNDKESARANIEMARLVGNEQANELLQALF